MRIVGEDSKEETCVFSNRNTYFLKAMLLLTEGDSKNLQHTNGKKTKRQL